MTYQPLMDSMSSLIKKMRMLTGLTVAYGTKEAFQAASVGNIQETVWSDSSFVPCVRPIREHTLYDLASLTKLFTLISIMQLVEQRLISLADPIGYIDSRFPYLKNVALRDVICYEAVLKTPQRIDQQQSRDKALEQVFQTSVSPIEPLRLYSDMNALLLKYVVETVSDLPFYEYLSQHILSSSGMIETYSMIPKDRIDDCACYNYEHRILADQYCLRMDVPLGAPHDPKAQILCDGGRDLCGHAGLFSTAADMIKLCQALLSLKLLKRETLIEIGTNRTGRIGADGGYRQYLGYLCFVKSPLQRFSEVPRWMGDHAFGMSGFTGNHIAIDPEAGIFDLFLGNRCHNRVSVIQPLEGKTVTDYGITKEGCGLVDWQDGRKVQSSYLYIHQKDNMLHEPIRKHLQELGWRPNHQ